MQLKDDDVREFIAIYQEEYGVALSLDEGREMAERLLTLYDLVLRPLPGELEEENAA